MCAMLHSPPQRRPISVPNDWARLEEVVLGSSRAGRFFGSHAILQEADYSPWRRMTARVRSLVAGRRVPQWVLRKYVEEEDALEKVLKARGIRVHRPAPIEVLPGDAPGLSQKFPRDPIMAIGDTMIRGRLQIDSRRKEVRGLDPLLQDLRAAGGKVIAVPESGDHFLEGGDFIVDLPYVFVGIGKYASTLAATRWLSEQLGPGITVVPVPLVPGGILHLDCCMTLIGPRLGIIHRPSLLAPLPAPLDQHDFIEVDAKTRAELGTNVLMLDPKTIVVQERHVELQAQLRRRGFTVIAISFSHHNVLGGSFRCATAPIKRTWERHE